ncbi:MAG: hypothetical protein U5J78_03500 [Parasphingorhabdus sp.]|nr:hypothetical protein [Parasphingorhabdus sp.]
MSVDKKLHTAPTVTAKIRAHYVDNARDLPWRSPLGTPPPDPYHVWLSEIMLQQTTVAAVIPYFERFTQRWRNVAALASADLADVLAAWAGLGYYARARNLHKCANAVTHHHGGIFPRAESELRKLPGIGDYTAAAIAAIAYGERAIVIDANIERIVARLFAISTPLPRGKSEILAAMDRYCPTQRGWRFCTGLHGFGCNDLHRAQPHLSALPVSR